GQEEEWKAKMNHLFITMDNICQFAFRSRLVRENLMTGPRFDFHDSNSMRKSYKRKRLELRDYLEKEGGDFTTINQLQILVVLLFAGIVSMIIAVNPQYVWTTYTKVVEVVEDEDDE
ncbi:hypothetical protein PMAYCL1PPCAC_05527, partial [Pristionchus mayeri]